MPGSPVFGLCVLFHVGSRLEPRGRAGFAHLFEHLMFQGTPRTPKGLFDRLSEASGGINNGQTRPDVTIYVSTAPLSALDRFLWLEADRMAALDFSQETLDNQRDVVKEEIRVNVRNDPYGLFEYGELPGKLFDKWENAHDGYGDFADLDAATLDDVRSFFATYYRPSNAVLAVAGGVSAGDVFERAERRFESIPGGASPPRPDLAEPSRPSPSLTVSKAPLARTPALVAGWRMPPPEHPDVVPLLVLGELLHNGRASRLYRSLVTREELAVEIWGGFNPFQGGVWYDGTTLMLSKVGYRRDATAARVLAALDAEVRRIAAGDVAADELARAKTKLVAGFWSGIEPPLDLAVELAQAATFSGRPEEVARFPGRVEAVTPEELARAAAWLSPEVRAVVVKEPGA